MRFVADEGVDAPIVGLLREADHQVWYVAEMSAGISDDEVLTIANEQAAVLITALNRLLDSPATAWDPPHLTRAAGGRAS